MQVKPNETCNMNIFTNLKMLFILQFSWPNHAQSVPRTILLSLQGGEKIALYPSTDCVKDYNGNTKTPKVWLEKLLLCTHRNLFWPKSPQSGKRIIFWSKWRKKTSDRPTGGTHKLCEGLKCIHKKRLFFSCKYQGCSIQGIWLSIGYQIFTGLALPISISIIFFLEIWYHTIILEILNFLVITCNKTQDRDFGK